MKSVVAGAGPNTGSEPPLRMERSFVSRYVVVRVAQMVLVFFGVTFLIHMCVWVLPGDPVSQLAGTNQSVSPSTLQAIREQQHLDDPLLVQYFKSLGNLLTGNLGTDLAGREIAPQLQDRWPITTKLAVTSIAMEALLGIGLGVLAAIRHRRLSDRAIRWISTGFLAVPLFVLAYAAQFFVGINLGILPVAGVSDGWPTSYLLPAAVLAALNSAVVLRVVRADVLEGVRSDYARTAAAKGLTRRRVLTRHVLRNSLIPVVTMLALDLGFLLGGGIIVESIFNLPGVGQLAFQSIKLQQGPTVVAITTLLVMIFLVINLLVDLLYGLLDPRIRRGQI